MPLSPSQINEHLTRWKPLVVGLAMKFRGKLGVAHDLDDIIAIGMVALWKAAESFDEHNEAGAHFSTYARRCVLYCYLGEVKALNSANRRVAYHSRDSLDEEHADGKPVFTLRSETRDAEQALIQERAEMALASARARLPDKLKLVLHRRFEKGRSFEEIGDELGVSKQRAGQMEIEALGKLRSRLRAVQAY